MKNLIYISFLIVLSIFSNPLWPQQKVDGIAAIVGNEIILFSEVNAIVAQYALQNKINIMENPKLYEDLSQKILQDLINEKLLLIKADEDTIKADEERVEQALDQQLNYMIEQVGSVESLESYYNAPIAKIKKDFRKQVENRFRIDVLRQKRFGNMKISRREVEEFYKQYQDSIPTLQPTVDLSHILIEVAPSEESRQEAYLKIQKIKEMLDQGGNFTELASEYSDDPGSAARGGDLGFISRGDLVKEFEEAAFALSEGEYSDIIRSVFGYHIIQLIERQGEKIHVRHILIQLKPTEKDAQIVIQKLIEIRQQILDGTTTFEEMALKYSDDPNVKDDKGNLGTYRMDSFQIKEFESVARKLEPGKISEPFRTDFGYHIVKLNNKTESREVSLETDWAQIEQAALQSKREKEFYNWLSSLRQEIPIEIKTES
jgi:peptidyl-prolyl cis-trans isomerase SurA